MVEACHSHRVLETDLARQGIRLVVPVVPAVLVGQNDSGRARRMEGILEEIVHADWGNLEAAVAAAGAVGRLENFLDELVVVGPITRPLY